MPNYHRKKEKSQGEGREAVHVFVYKIVGAEKGFEVGTLFWKLLQGIWGNWNIVREQGYQASKIRS